MESKDERVERIMKHIDEETKNYIEQLTPFLCMLKGIDEDTWHKLTLDFKKIQDTVYIDNMSVVRIKGHKKFSDDFIGSR